MAASLTIGGVEYISWLKRESLTHVDDLTGNPDTLAFELNPTNGAGTAVTKPSAGQEVIYTKADSTRLFGGVLGDPHEKPDGFRQMGYTCNATDYRTWLDRRVLNDRYVSEKPGAVAAALIKKYAPEFDTSGIDTTGGPTIASIRFKRNERITDALKRLCDLTGYTWDVKPNKHVVFYATGSVAAAWDLRDSGNAFANLEVVWDRNALRNSVIVKGAKYPASTATVDYFSGDGVTTNFRLTKTPYGLDQYQVFAEAWSSFDTTVWTKADVSNPSPPAGHIAGDGYIFTTIQQGGALAESGKLQIVGGDGTWGDSRVWSATPQDRGDGYRRFEFDVFADGGGNTRAGLWDPNNTVALAGEQHGVIFQAGTLVPSEGGTSKTALATVNYSTGHSVRVRIVPKSTSGAVTWVNIDDANGFRSSQWTKLYDSSAGSLTQFAVVPAFDKDFVGRVGRVKILNRLYGISVTVGGTDQFVGLLNVDNDGGLDAVIGLEANQAPCLVFFSDTIPASGTRNIVATYDEAIPILHTDQDVTSIATVKALENPSNLANGSDGVYEGYIEDKTLDSLDLARQRAKQELAQWANPVVTLTFTTWTSGLAAGQLLPVNLTSAGSGRTVTGSYLIQKVETKSLGSDQYEYAVTAGSRLKGVHEYLIDLLQAGLKLVAQADDNAPLDQATSAVDTIDFAESFSVTTGPVGPYLYYGNGLRISLEDASGDLLLEDGTSYLLTDDMADTHALYGQACYT